MELRYIFPKNIDFDNKSENRFTVNLTGNNIIPLTETIF